MPFAEKSTERIVVSNSMTISIGISLGSLLVALVSLIWTSWDRLQQRMKGQANRISAWQSVTDSSENVVINNVSDSPVYNVVIAYSVPNKGYPFMKPGRDPRESVFIPIVPPGTYTTHFVPFGMAGMSARPEVEMAFTDVGGRSWIRDGAGKLKRIRPQHPVSFHKGGFHFNHVCPQDYMGITLPEICSEIRPFKQTDNSES